jgi:hypothetical protein
MKLKAALYFIAEALMAVAVIAFPVLLKCLIDPL